ncbi:MAG TPA: histidine phosphatase family protein [Micromonospora sp.]
MTEHSIVLLRHAKAEAAGKTDADRPLTARGHADAAAAGAWLAYEGYWPGLVICSPAKRTRQTWHDVALGMAEPPATPTVAAPGGAPRPADLPARGPTVRYESDVYHGGATELLDLLRSVGPEIATVLLVGHNPAVSQLSLRLDPVHADPEGLRTCGLAVHRFSGEWTGLRPEGAPLATWYTARG